MNQNDTAALVGGVSFKWKGRVYSTGHKSFDLIVKFLDANFTRVENVRAGLERDAGLHPVAWVVGERITGVMNRNEIIIIDDWLYASAQAVGRAAQYEIEPAPVALPVEPAPAVEVHPLTEAREAAAAYLIRTRDAMWAANSARSAGGTWLDYERACLAWERAGELYAERVAAEAEWLEQLANPPADVPVVAPVVAPAPVDGPMNRAQVEWLANGADIASNERAAAQVADKQQSNGWWAPRLDKAQQREEEMQARAGRACAALVRSEGRTLDVAPDLDALNFALGALMEARCVLEMADEPTLEMAEVMLSAGEAFNRELELARERGEEIAPEVSAQRLDLPPPLDRCPEHDLPIVRADVLRLSHELARLTYVDDERAEVTRSVLNAKVDRVAWLLVRDGLERAACALTHPLTSAGTFPRSTQLHTGVGSGTVCELNPFLSWETSSSAFWMVAQFPYSNGVGMAFNVGWRAADGVGCSDSEWERRCFVWALAAARWAPVFEREVVATEEAMRAQAAGTSSDAPAASWQRVWLAFDAAASTGIIFRSEPGAKPGPSLRAVLVECAQARIMARHAEELIASMRKHLGELWAHVRDPEAFKLSPVLNSIVSSHAAAMGFPHQCVGRACRYLRAQPVEWFRAP